MTRRYNHLTLADRVMIEYLVKSTYSLQMIANHLGRSKSTISTEIKRNTRSDGVYDAEYAHDKYLGRRKGCRRRLRLLMKDGLIAFIAKKMRFNHWSPREVAQFLKEVGAEVQVSAKTIYRGIKRGLFDEYADKKPFKRYLRHHGKRRKNKLFKEKRGRFEIDLTIHDRPEECNSRERTGDWEIDTVAGKQGGKCLVTAVDRRSRYLLARLSNSKSSDDVSEALIKMFEGEDVKTVTADQGKEFAKYRDIVNKIGAPIYFADAGKPWQRGTNENTNGLIRDYMPKGQSMDEYSDEFVQWCVNDLNCRPRQCLDYRTPQEVYNSEREV